MYKKCRPTFVRKNSTKFDGSKGILPETENGRVFAPVSRDMNPRSAASQSRSEECRRLREEDVVDALLRVCSTSNSETLFGEPGKGRTSERLEDDEAEEAEERGEERGEERTPGIDEDMADGMQGKIQQGRQSRDGPY